MDSTILTEILGSIVNAASQGFDDISFHAKSLFFKLLIIEVVLLGIGIALNRIDVQRELVFKILAVGFVQFLLFRYVWLVDNLRDGFVRLGLAAAGGQMSISEFLDPSAFVKLGFDRVYDVIEPRFDHGTWTFLTSPTLVWMLYGVILLLMFFAFAAIGLQIFLVVIEFYLVSTLAIIMIPFLVLQRTSFLGLRAINGLIAICIKLMVIAFVASLSSPILELLTFTNSEPNIKEAMGLALGALAIALLMWRAPSMAMSLISGGGGLDVSSTILEPVFRGANAMGGVGSMAKGAATSVTKKVGNAVSQGVGHARG